MHLTGSYFQVIFSCSEDPFQFFSQLHFDYPSLSWVTHQLFGSYVSAEASKHASHSHLPSVFNWYVSYPSLLRVDFIYLLLCL
jgi:hypothetical protein